MLPLFRICRKLSAVTCYITSISLAISFPGKSSEKIIQRNISFKRTGFLKTLRYDATTTTAVLSIAHKLITPRQSSSKHGRRTFLYSAIRADENTGGALLEFSMRTGMHGKSRVSYAISVCDNQ